MKTQLEQLLASFVSERTVHGVCASISIRERETVYASAGFADAACQMRMDENVQLRIYSMTKPVVACAVMQLAEQGKLSLLDPVEKHLPCFANQKVRCADGRLAAAKRCTILNLLEMTSGIVPYYRDHSPEVQALRSRVAASEKTSDPMDTRTLADAIAQIPLGHQPGEGFIYGMSFEILAAVIESVTGMRLGEYLLYNVFAPLSMNDTAFFSNRSERRADILTNKNGTFSIAKEERYQPVLQPPAIEWGGDGLYSTLRDFTQFAQSLTYGAPLLKPETIRRMAQPEPLELCRSHFDSIGILRGCGYGLGQRVVCHPQDGVPTSAIGEYGWYGHAGSWFMCHAEKKVSAVLLTQCLPSPHDALVSRFRAFVYKTLKA
jgi:CubicO group peptidase (beta-lactamase class C family)